MRKILILGCLLFFISSTYGKKLDLIVTTEGDSIACKILEVNDSEIIFNMEAYGHKNVQTRINRENIIEFKYEAIQKDLYNFKPGTSYIAGKSYQLSSYFVEKKYPISRKTYSLSYLQNASDEELEYYRFKAMKKRKIGRILSIAGPITSITGFILAYSSFNGGNDWLSEPSIFMFYGGIGATVAGLTMKSTGKKRIERINTIRNTAQNGTSVYLNPCAQYNYYTQNYQPVMALSIIF